MTYVRPCAGGTGRGGVPAADRFWRHRTDRTLRPVRPTVMPVNYRLYEGTIVFRTTPDSATDEDLRTGIANAEYKVAFEIDDFDTAARTGWSVLIQGSAHHVESEAERASVAGAGVDPWPGGGRELFLRIMPSRVTGRRVSHTS